MWKVLEFIHLVLFLTQTGGHGDFRDLSNRNPILTGAHDSQLERLGYYIIADGRDLVLTGVRQKLDARRISNKNYGREEELLHNMILSILLNIH